MNALNNTELKVTIAAEDSVNYNFTVGDEVHLGYDNGRYVIVDENNRIVPAQLVSNISLEDAKMLSDIKAVFAIKKIEGNVLKAEMVNPYSYVHHACGVWTCLN
ncbi:MAG: hypothetical protein IKG53_10840 [Solobacterium sp.]|nr:hypothetical protein [Solobacterium sp.]